MANLFILLFLAICALSVSADVLVSIDCGYTGSDFYTDAYSNVWQGDKDLIQNGVTQVVQSSNSVSRVMDTLRVFTTRKKNCYLIQVDMGGQVFIRASFNYGNYDQKSSPPTFDLQFDGNYWTTVNTSNTGVVSHEAVYVVKGDIISVCVAQTKPGQFPFISALEVRSLDSDMYNRESNHALFLKSRVAYGADADVRFPDDFYDRIWAPGEIGNGFVNVTSDSNALPFEVNIADRPPLAVLQNAISTASKSDNLILDTGFPTDDIPVYLNMYFSDLTELDLTENRSFELYIDNQSSTDPIIPPYENVTEYIFSNLTVSSTTTFSLVATSNSTLPPLINAMEVFYISKELTDGTNSDDVGGLALLQGTFAVLQDWSGDPCLPASFNWDWLDCSTDATPRVTAMHLSSFGLLGSLPDLSSMNALETIDLHNNSLNGPIPDFLGTLPNLKELNLADNQFSGPIPASLSKNNKLKLDVTGNPDLCTSGKSCNQATDSPYSSAIPATPSLSRGKKKSNKLPVILGSTIPSGLVVSAIASFFSWLHHKRKKASVAATGPGHSVSGHSGGANRPNGTPVNNHGKLGKFGQALFNEVKDNIEEQVIGELSNEINQQPQGVAPGNV